MKKETQREQNTRDQKKVKHKELVMLESQTPKLEKTTNCTS